MFKRLQSFCFADKVYYSKTKAFSLPKQLKTLKGKIVAMQNPYKPDQIIFRRVIATEYLWVKRLDNGGII